MFLRRAHIVLLLLPLSFFGQLKTTAIAKDTFFELSDFSQLIGQDTSLFSPQLQKKYFKGDPAPVASFSTCQSGNCDGMPVQLYGLVAMAQNIKITACVNSKSNKIISFHLHLPDKKYLSKQELMKGLADGNFIHIKGTDNYVQSSTGIELLVKSKGKSIKNISIYRRL